MRKYARTASCDSRGQLVIPKEVRKELSIEEGTAFWAFVIENEGILVKRIHDETLDPHEHILKEMYDKSSKLGIEKKSISNAVSVYTKKEKGGFKEL